MTQYVQNSPNSTHLLYVDAAEFQEAFSQMPIETAQQLNSIKAWLIRKNNMLALKGAGLKIGAGYHVIDWSCGRTSRPNAVDREVVAGEFTGQLIAYNTLPYDNPLTQSRILALSTVILSDIKVNESMVYQPALVQTPIVGAEIELVPVLEDQETL